MIEVANIGEDKLGFLVSPVVVKTANSTALGVSYSGLHRSANLALANREPLRRWESQTRPVLRFQTHREPN